MHRLAVPFVVLSVIVVLCHGTVAHAEAPGATNTTKPHVSSKRHVAVGLDLGWGGPYGDVGLRLGVAPHHIFSVEIGGGIGYSTVGMGLLVRARAVDDELGASVAVGVTRGKEYGSADGDEFVDVTRGIVELSVRRHIGGSTSLVLRGGVKASTGPIEYLSSFSAGDYYEELDQFVPFFGITISVAVGL